MAGGAGWGMKEKEQEKELCCYNAVTRSSVDPACLCVPDMSCPPGQSW